ncbi:hypothetical protein, partial [Haloferax chudinovii]
MSSDGDQPTGGVEGTQPGAEPWPSKETNSVEAQRERSRDSSEPDELVHERVLEFAQKYPELAEM